MITLFNDKIQTTLYTTLAFKFVNKGQNKLKFDGKTQEVEVEKLKRKI